MAEKVVLLLDPDDRELAEQLSAQSGRPVFDSDKADGTADLIVQVMSLTSASISVVASYLALKGASPRSKIKEDLSERPLNEATLKDLRGRIDDDQTGTD